MTSHRSRNRALLVAPLVILLGVTACSHHSGPTAPPGGGGSGGGGGGGGTSFNLGPFAVRQSATFTFGSAGTFGYHCIPHQSMGMTGTVQVDTGGTDSLVVQIGAGGGLTFTPSFAHIKPGGYVRWVNASSSTVHTVTSD